MRLFRCNCKPDVLLRELHCDAASILYSLILFVMIEYNLEIHQNTKVNIISF
jgi:hypothetical protein